jgi:hypothetical protein
MMRVQDLFVVKYGTNLELNAMRQSTTGVNFVSRTARNNGVSARVAPVDETTPLPAGTISVAGGGSVMASFLQTEPYYTGRDVYYLTSKQPLTDQQKLFYCVCLSANRYRYNYNRQANRTLRDILIPEPQDVPSWVAKSDPDVFKGKDAPATSKPPLLLQTKKWKPFVLSSLFELRKGKRLTKAARLPGVTPFIGALDKNNGVTGFVEQEALHPAGTMTVNYNGNGVAEAYYQPAPFRCSDDVNVLYPKFELTPQRALFIATVIRQEKYRFNYGRKWHLERMRDAVIRLPAKNGNPDWVEMDEYISRLPFSSQIAR